MSPTLPFISMSVAKSSRLESLTPEIAANIFQELLTLSKNNGCMEKRAPGAKWPRKHGFFPNIQPQVLRLSKSIHAIASDILDHSNQWVIFDMDCAHLMIARETANMSMIIVDPKSVQTLPSGMMNVRVQLYTHASVSTYTLNSRWPKTLPKRQVLMVPASNVGTFLDELRKVELSHAVRVMPGKAFRDYPSRQMRKAAIGVHGLSIRIHVDPRYSAKIIGATLEKFRSLHGPLNEISIVGAPDEQQARRIEASITAPRDAARESTFSEALMHAIRSLHLADLRSKDNPNQPVSLLYEQAREMLLNHRQLDRTPWAGRFTDENFHEFRFELLIMSACSTNWMVHNIITNGHWRFATIQALREVHVTRSTAWLVNQNGLERGHQAYHLLFGALHCMFSCRLNRQDAFLAAVFHGLTLINETQDFITQMSRKERIFFRVAYKMYRRIVSLSSKIDAAAIAKVVESYRKWFSENLKPIKWRVHESFISQTLRNKGILETLWKMPSQPDEKLDRYHIIDTFEVEEGIEGDYYLL